MLEIEQGGNHGGYVQHQWVPCYVAVAQEQIRMRNESQAKQCAVKIMGGSVSFWERGKDPGR